MKKFCQDVIDPEDGKIYYYYVKEVDNDYVSKESELQAVMEMNDDLKIDHVDNIFGSFPVLCEKKIAFRG